VLPRQPLRSPVAEGTLAAPIGDNLQAESFPLFSWNHAWTASSPAFVARTANARDYRTRFRAGIDRLDQDRALLQEEVPPAVHAGRSNHVWHVDLTAVPTRLGFRVPWRPGAIPQKCGRVG